MNIRKHIFFSFILVLLFFCTGCQTSSLSKTPEEFDTFTHNLFVKEVQSDSITLNYTLANPKQYGITQSAITFGQFSTEELELSYAEIENYLASLKQFSYKDLTKEQQLTYDILKQYLELELSSSDYMLYREALGPNTGLQAQLPVLLSEYHFYEKTDIETYLKLLEDLPRYFQQIGTFEVQKSNAGLFMSDTTANSIIEQCKNFIADKETNVLIEIFNDRIQTLDFLSSEEITDYKNQNTKLVMEYVIPAYEGLMEQIEALKGTGTNEGGLCNFPNGKEYYEYLIASTTGSSRSMRKIDEMLTEAINNGLNTMIEIANKDLSIFEKADQVVYPLTDPTEIIEYLKVAIQENYPSLEDVNYNIKYVHKSLEKDLSPAFYLTPPLDDCLENSIYINNYSAYNKDNIFPTLAHEGYPGHLFQNVYFNQTSPTPIRTLFAFGGYSEGWATYAEMDSYSMMNLDSNITSILMNNQISTLCMYAQIDLGIHYFGWTKEETARYLDSYGLPSVDIVDEIYQTMVAEPGNYMKYALGYLEILKLREQAQKQLKTAFSLKEWNTFFLDIGPAPFEIIENYMNDWIKECK